MNSEIEKKLFKKAKFYVKLLQVVPFVRMVAVCNNLAFGKVDSDSDIDLFVIAKKDRLFIVRTLVTFLLHVLGVRRHGEYVSERFCLSFFVDEEFMDLSEIAIHRDIYLAYWIRSLVPLINRRQTAEKFLENNSWAKRYFENGEDFAVNKEHVMRESLILGGVRLFLSIPFTSFLGWFAETVLKRWQLKRAEKKVKEEVGMNSIVIGDHILKFHNVDRRREYRNKWDRRFGEEAKLTTEKFMKI